LKRHADAKLSGLFVNNTREGEEKSFLTLVAGVLAFTERVHHAHPSTQ
jgi:hypothetical protein